MTKAVSEGWPKARITEAATRKQARIERGIDIIVGVNRFQIDPQSDAPVDIRSIDNNEVRKEQIDRLTRVRAERDGARVEAALAALTRAAAGTENLLALAVEAARARASVGEISSALEAVWGRHGGDTGNVVGAYGRYYEDDAAWLALRARIEDFERLVGRRPRLLVAKLGQDGHDRGARLIACAFADAGFDVDVGPLFQTPSEVAEQAIDNDVHVVGISTQAGGHLTLVPQLVDRLRQLGAGDVVTVCGGIIPDADHAALNAAGVALVFGPGTPMVAAIERVLQQIWPVPPDVPRSGGAS